METTLHRQLKALYSRSAAQQEVSVDGYRIDVREAGRLIEIQNGSLNALREKARALLRRHELLIVKPLAGRKYLIKRARKRGKIVSARFSPLRETWYDLFLDLVHFVDVFPHPRLTLELLLTEQEEHRLPALRSGRRKRGYRVEDRKLRAVTDRLQFRAAGDLLCLLPSSVPEPFSTADIAREADIPRWLAQKMAYCLRKTGAAQPVERQGNTILYELTVSRADRSLERSLRAA